MIKCRMSLNIPKPKKGWALVNKEINEIDKYISRFREIDWQRSNKIWAERMIRPNGKVINNETAVYLIGNAIKKEIGMPLTKEEEKKEKAFEVTK